MHLPVATFMFYLDSFILFVYVCVQQCLQLADDAYASKVDTVSCRTDHMREAHIALACEAYASLTIFPPSA